MRQPLAIDLFSGLGGWTDGLLAEGYRVIGFDIEQHVYGTERYPAQLVIQDVRTIHGAQFKDAALIVASPPCQPYSYRAMPWKRAKALPPPDNSLFEACFRIQREAIEAAGHFIPLVVENVRGAQPYVGRSKYHFGSFHLWGDVPALMPPTAQRRMKQSGTGGRLWSERQYEGDGAAFHQEAYARKNSGGSWFNIAHNTTSGHGQNPDGRKTVGHLNKRDGHSHTRHLTNQSEHIKNGGDWFGAGADCSLQRKASSKGSSRKRASALIAKIPLVLSRHIAASWYPVPQTSSIVRP